MKHERRVLAAWIVGGQLVTLPCVGLATMMGALGVRPETDMATRAVLFALPCVPCGHPVPRTRKPGDRGQETGIRSQAVETKKQEPDNKNQEPRTRNLPTNH